MAKLDKNKWLATNPYEFERDKDGDLCILIFENGELLRQKLPDNSVTKFILNKLRKEGALDYEKPTKKQARAILIKKLLGEIRELEEKVKKKRSFLSDLNAGNFDDNIKIEDHKEKQWYTDMDETEINVWSFVDKEDFQ